MGCGGSKTHKKEKCNMDLEKTGISDIDNIFDSIAAPMLTLAELNNLLKKGENKIKRRTHTYLLTGWTLEDSIIAILFAISAETNGDFDKAGLKFTPEPPFLNISKELVDKLFHEVVDAWDYLVEKIMDASAKLIELPGQIATIIQEAPGYNQRAKIAVENAGLNTAEKFKIGKVIAGNLHKITKANVVMEETKKILDNLTKVAKSLKEKFDNDGIEKIHAVGKEIHKSKVKDMREIIVNYWPDKTRVDLKLERPRKSKPANNT